MTMLWELRAKVKTLDEIRAIFRAMKNLAVIELNKVARLMSAQHNIAVNIEAALSDFEHFFGGNVPKKAPEDRVLYVLIGSERGFCGPFNEDVLAAFSQDAKDKNDVKIAVVGHRLADKLEGDARVQVVLDGPNCADEIPHVISKLAEELVQFADCRWLFVHNENGGLQTKVTSFYPREESSTNPRNESEPPLLYLPSQDLYPQLLEQYLYSMMHYYFYVSFMSENKARLEHMEGALNAIEKEEKHLTTSLNTMRQEQITEELEVLMMNVPDSFT